MRLIDFFDKGVERDPGRLFVVDDTTRITYGEAQEASVRLASTLQASGVGPGTRIAVLSDNTARASEAVVGLLRAGCVWVTVASAGAEEIAEALKSTATEVLFFSKSYRDRVDRILAACPCLRMAFCIEEEVDGYSSLPRLRQRGCDAVVAVEEEADAVATLLSSGGTSGTPKGVMMTNAAWEILVASSTSNIGYVGGVRLVVAPLTQTAGAASFLTEMAMGRTFVLQRGFDPERLVRAIEDYRVTHLFLAPAAIRLLLTYPGVRGRDYSSLRSLIYGGAPTTRDTVLEAMDLFGPVMATGFAQTETGGPVTYLSPQDHVIAKNENRTDRLASCGRETLFARVEIMGSDETLLPRGQEGEVVVRSGHLMKGYYRGPSETPDEARRIRGWHLTGDIGVKDPEGFVHIVDRKRDVIISRGYNIFPAEVEKILESQPGVLGCAVIGAPHDTMGEVVTAVVEVAQGRVVDTNRLRAACRERLAPPKVPVSIEVWPKLPRSGAGKVLRRQVREAFWKDRPNRI